jgi:hypothetical protein
LRVTPGGERVTRCLAGRRPDMRRAKPKSWPRSWKQAAIVGGTLILKGRSVEHALVVLTVRVEANTPEELDEALVEHLRRAPES